MTRYAPGVRPTPMPTPMANNPRSGVKPTVTGAPYTNLPFIIDNKPIPGTRPIGVVKPQVGPFGGFSGDPKPAPMPMAGTRPGVTTGGPLIKPNQTPLQGVNPTVGRLPQAGSKPTPPSMVGDILKTAQAKGMLGAAPVGIGSASAQANPKMMSGLSGMGAALGKRMGMKKGGAVKKKASSYKSGGSVSSASKRADGCAIKGKTKGKMV